MSVSEISLQTLDLTSARENLASGLDSGALWMNYVGHGGADRFAGEGLLTAADVDAASPSLGRIPVVTALTCAVNRFELPGWTSLGEALVLDPDGGAVAIIAPTGFSNHPAAVDYGDQLLTSALGEAGGTRIGEAMVAAAASSSLDSDLLAIYALLGDPALLLPPIPEAELLFKANFELGTIGEFSLSSP
jgi:hypothetical protein